MFVRQTLGVSCIEVDTASNTYYLLRVSILDRHLDVIVQIVFVYCFSFGSAPKKATGVFDLD